MASGKLIVVFAVMFAGVPSDIAGFLCLACVSPHGFLPGVPWPG